MQQNVPEGGTIPYTSKGHGTADLYHSFYRLALMSLSTNSNIFLVHVASQAQYVGFVLPSTTFT